MGVARVLAGILRKGVASCWSFSEKTVAIELAPECVCLFFFFFFFLAVLWMDGTDLL